LSPAERVTLANDTAERSLFWIWTVGIACIVIAFLFLAAGSQRHGQGCTCQHNVSKFHTLFVLKVN
jgi:hypothetical protein